MLLYPKELMSLSLSKPADFDDNDLIEESQEDELTEGFNQISSSHKKK